MLRLAKNVSIFYTIAVIGGHCFFCKKLIVFQMQNNFSLMGKFSCFLHSIEKNKRVAFFLYFSFSIIFILTSQNCCV